MSAIPREVIQNAVMTLTGQDGFKWLALATRETINANSDNVDAATREVLRLIGTYIVESSQHQQLSTLMRGFGESLREQATSHEHYNQ